ncbi:MAG TPA: AAA family ATPase [Candidatus Binatia bacterium]
MKISIFPVGDESIAFACLRQLLAGVHGYHVEGRAFSCSEAVEHLKKARGSSVAVIDLQSDPVKSWRLAVDLRSKLPEVRLVLTSPRNDPEITQQAKSVGADEFLAQPLVGEEVLRVFDAVRKKIDTGIAPACKKGKVIAITSNKGGAGTTTAATNIAANLASRSKRICLFDLVLQVGSVTSFLNVEPSYTILDLVKTIRRTEPTFREEFLTKHASGVRVLAEPFRGEDSRRITPADIDEILDMLALTFDFIVIDTPKAFDDMQTTVLDKADVILFLTEMDVPSLRGARRAFDLFQAMGVDNGKIRLMLNRYVDNQIINLEMVEKALGMNVFWTLPNNYPAAVAAINQGLPIEACDFRSDIAKSYAGLTDAILRSSGFACTTVPQSSVPARPGLLERWLNAGGLRK